MDSPLLLEQEMLIEPLKQGRLGYISGLVPKAKAIAFERILFRATRGNMYLKQAAVEEPVTDPVSGEKVEKIVFVIFFSGERARAKILKICDAFGENRYPFPEEFSKQRQMIGEDFSQRWQRQSRAFSNLFRQADRVEKLAEVIERLEQGDLKLRVCTLESERAFKRVAAAQKTIVNAVLAGTLVNLATILHINSIRLPAIAAYFGSAIFFLQVLIGVLQVRNLDQQERLITGTT